ncbi:hypothetical protein BGX24_005111 [Mortierella sp. AD032]|nr:hypothetical protein BGX24_005111 [Mortierella sp. AD032]
MAAIMKVLDFLELTQFIANDLTQHDLALCCQVNKSFSIAFTPHLWHSITIQHTDPVPKFRTPEGCAGLLRNGHHIRVLRTYDPAALEPFLKYGKTCTKLVSFDTQYWYYTIGRFPSPAPTHRPLAMMSKGRRWSIGSGQKPPQVIGRDGGQCHSSGVVFGNSSTSGIFGSPAPTSTGFGIVPVSTGFGAPTTGSSASSVTVFGTPLTPGGLGGHGAVPSSSSSAIKIPNKGTKSDAKARKDAETIVIALLTQNPHLEFLVLPSWCLENESIVALMEESLLSLKEFHSQVSNARQGTFQENAQAGRVEFSLFDRSVIRNGTRAVSGFRGCIRPIADAAVGVGGGGDSGISVEAMALLNKYPRLRSLQLDLVATINREELEALKTVTDTSMTCLEIDVGDCHSVEQACHQVLMNAPFLLTSIELTMRGPGNKIRFNNTVMDAFLRHAPTLEYIDASSYCFDSETLQALLNTGPLLKSIRTMEDSMVYRPSLETELDALGAATNHPWACKQLQIFECKITNVPRPDITVTEIDDLDDLPIRWTPPASVMDPFIFTIAQEESHALQRRLLKNLGRCTHLRKLWLGTCGSNRDDPEYSYLQIRGIRTMLIDSYVQTSCLELSLASGLDELSGLKELEELVIWRMAHRIGVAEVKWMVEHWPKLKIIRGLRYSDSDDELRNDDEDEDEGQGQEEEKEEEEDVDSEPILWLRENMPDIEVS